MVNNILAFSGELDDNKHAIPVNTTVNTLHCMLKIEAEHCVYVD